MPSDDEAFRKAEAKLTAAKNMGISEADKALSTLKAKWRKAVVQKRKEQALQDLDNLKRESDKLKKQHAYTKALKLWQNYKKNGRFAEELQLYLDDAIEKLEKLIKKRIKTKEEDI
jgi:type II secretory pathway component PulF